APARAQTRLISPRCHERGCDPPRQRRGAPRATRHAPRATRHAPRATRHRHAPAYRPRTTNTTRALRRVPALSAVTVTRCRPGRAARTQTAGSRAAATRAPRTRRATDPGGVTRTTNRAVRPGRTARALGVTRRPNP